MRVGHRPEAPIDAWCGDEGSPSQPSEGARVLTTHASAALTPSGLSGFDWALNPYLGCAHGCAYCYAPAVLRTERSAFATRVLARQNLPALLARELRRRERGVVGVGTVTDAYQGAERTCQLTRFCLQALARRDWPVCVLTKSDLVVRDADVLGGLTECEVGLTVTTLDEHQRRLLEPGAPPTARRLAAMRLLSDGGIATYAFIGPVPPTATLSGLRELVRRVHGAGARHVLVDRLNAREGVWPSISRALASDPQLHSLARRRLFGRQGGEDFYEAAIGTVVDEARALGLPVQRA